MSKLLQPRRAICGVILDTPDVLMGCPVIDAFVDVVTYISWWRS
jgi:hypothetical protein